MRCVRHRACRPVLPLMMRPLVRHILRTILAAVPSSCAPSLHAQAAEAQGNGADLCPESGECGTGTTTGSVVRAKSGHFHCHEYNFHRSEGRNRRFPAMRAEDQPVIRSRQGHRAGAICSSPMPMGTNDNFKGVAMPFRSGTSSFQIRSSSRTGSQAASAAARTGGRPDKAPRVAAQGQDTALVKLSTAGGWLLFLVSRH